MADTLLILHVKGTDQTTTLPKPVVRAGIAQGQITHSQLIWSPTDNAWKQVRELPHLLPSQKLAPAPARRAITQPSALPRPVPAIAPVAEPQPEVQAHPRVRVAATGPTPKVAAAQPRVAAQPKVASTPKVAVAQAHVAPTVAQPRVAPAVSAATISEEHLVPPDESALRTAKWVCLAVGGLLLAIVGLNYFLVDRPLSANLAATAFAQVPVHAHLGAFIQPGALMIHILPSPQVTAENFPTFLATLARRTPSRPGGDIFDRVSITPGWLGRYSFAGTAWDQLGSMVHEDPAKQRDFILSQLDSASGTPLLAPDASDEMRDKVWAGFVGDFTRS